MALTVTKVTSQRSNGLPRLGWVDVTFDSSYPTAGEDAAALIKAALGFKTITHVGDGIALTSGGTTGILTAYKHATGKLLALWGNAGTAGVLPEVTSTTDLSTFSVRLRVEGE